MEKDKNYERSEEKRTFLEIGIRIIIILYLIILISFFIFLLSTIYIIKKISIIIFIFSLLFSLFFSIVMYALQEVNAKEIYEELNENISIANVSVILLKKNKIIVKPIDNGKYGKIVSALNKKGCFYATLNKNNFKLVDISYSFYNKKEEIPVETIKVIKLLEYYNTIE